MPQPWASAGDAHHLELGATAVARCRYRLPVRHCGAHRTGGMPWCCCATAAVRARASLPQCCWLTFGPCDKVMCESCLRVTADDVFVPPLQIGARWGSWLRADFERSPLDSSWLPTAAQLGPQARWPLCSPRHELLCVLRRRQASPPICDEPDGSDHSACRLTMPKHSTTRFMCMEKVSFDTISIDKGLADCETQTLAAWHVYSHGLLEALVVTMAACACGCIGQS
jgi:hypothetical protein